MDGGAPSSPWSGDPLTLPAASTAGAVLLGVLQGITEFLPVSSSGHLVLFQQFVEVAGDDVLFDLVLHLGTLAPALWFYRADVRAVVSDAVAGEGPYLERPGVRLAALVVLATLPTVVIGLGFKDWFEAVFHTPWVVAAAFAVTGGFLLATRWAGEGRYGLANTPWRVALLVGLAQGCAITPGISRSGATIAAGLLLGLEREFAVKLSFLMSVPAILGAVVLKLSEVDLADASAVQLVAGAIASALTGYAALVVLVRLVRVGRFADFAWYLWVVAGITAAVAAGLLP